MRRLRRSLAADVTLLALLVGLVVFGGFLWLAQAWQKNWLAEQAQRSLLLAADTLTSALRYGMLRNCRDEIASTIDRVVRETRIEQVRVIQHGGQVRLAQGFERQSTHRVTPDQPACTACHRDGQVHDPGGRLPVRTVVHQGALHAYTVLRAEPACLTGGCHVAQARHGVLGVIDVGIPEHVIGQPLAGLQRRLLWAGGLVLVLGSGVLFLLLQLRVRRPMRELMAGIRRVADGDLEHAVPQRWADEFGELARAFNDMRRRLGRLQEGLVHTERLVSMGKLAAGVAHEINNPLTGILSYAEDLRDEAPAGSELRRDLEVIVRETLRCRRIVRDLLDFARRDGVLAEQVDLSALVEKTVQAVARREDFRGVEVSTAIDDQLPKLRADPVQLQQVLLNLLVNAAQAMPDGGRVVIAARARERQLELSVTDDGPGIPEQIRGHIFEPFFSTKQGRSDGLGLAVCHGIVQRHGGHIEVESEAGQGTTFRVLLPVAGPPQPVPGEEE